MDDEKIFKKYSSYFSKYYKNIKFLGITKEEYLKIVIEVIEYTNKNNNKEYDYKKLLYDNFDYRISKILIDELDRDFSSTIDNYIKKYFKNNKLIVNSKDVFNNINRIFKSLDYNASFEFIEELLNKSKKFNILCEDIYNQYNSYITNGKLEEITNNEFILSTMDVYCVLKNIEIEEKEERFYSGCGLEDSVLTYFKEISKYPLLTREEEQILGKRMLQGDEEAKRILIERNLKLVVKYAKRYRSLGLDFLDVIQEGNIGLMKAVEKFDFRKSYKFSTYATWWIKQTIFKALDEKSRLIRLPGYMIEKENRYKTIQNDFTQKYGREPTKEEIQKIGQFSDLNLKTLDSSRFEILSSDMLIDEDKDVTLISTIPSDDQDVDDVCFDKTCYKELYNLIDNCNLTEDEKYILKYRYGLGGCKIKTLRELANEFQLTYERIRQIENRIIERIRQYGNVSPLAVYLEDEKYAQNNLEKLNKERKTNRINSRTIYEYFYDVPKEKVDAAISRLRPEEQEILHKRYGEDLKHPVISVLNKEDNQTYRQTVLPMIKKYIINPNTRRNNKKQKTYVK